MLLKLHQLHIHLDSQDEAINRQWRWLFSGWILQDAEPHDMLTLQMHLADQLPSLPDAQPFFTDHKHTPDNVGSLSVYQGYDHQLRLHFFDGAVVDVPLSTEARTVTGVINKTVLAHGRFEDITFTSLAPLLRRRGYYLVHAFAASKNDKAVLIVGPSGSGKTTTGLSLILAGWRLLANDILLLEAQADGIYALPTPGGVSIRPHSVALLPKLAHRLGSTPLINGCYNMTGSWLANGRWSEPCRISSIYFPQIGEKHPCTVTPCSRAVGLARLMEESVDRWDEETLAAHINLLQQLVEETAVYDLHLGPDISQLPSLLT